MELESIVTIKNLHKSFPSVGAILKGVDLHFYQGKLTYILGSSGAGKSILLKHILGLIKPDHGSIFFRDTDLTQLSAKQLVPVRQNFGILFQNAALFDEMSIFENVAFPLREFTNLAEPDIQEQVALSLTKLGLPKSWDRSPTTLSGGQKKRVALARAIIRKPTVLLYDEPTTGLDPVNRIAVDELIDALKKDFQLTSIVISHDISSALFLGDFIAFLFEGHIIFFGPPAEFKKNDHPAIQGFLNAERRFTQYL